MLKSIQKIISKPPVFVYEKFIAKQRDGISFIVLFFFLIAFSISRIYVYLSTFDIVPDSLTQNINGVHVHHFAWGIFINSVVGYISLALPNKIFLKWKTKLAAAFGLGLGFTFDEFGMWLHLRDEYILRQGYDAIIIIGAYLINVIYFGKLWKKLIIKIIKPLRYNKKA